MNTNTALTVWSPLFQALCVGSSQLLNGIGTLISPFYRWRKWSPSGIKLCMHIRERFMNPNKVVLMPSYRPLHSGGFKFPTLLLSCLPCFIHSFTTLLLYQTLRISLKKRILKFSPFIDRSRSGQILMNPVIELII